MTQRCWTSGDYTIQAGWDRPLHYFYLVIDRVSTTDDDPVYSNLTDPLRGPGLSLMDIHQILEAYQVAIPPTLFSDLAEDRRHNRGNREVDYDTGVGVLDQRSEGC